MSSKFFAPLERVKVMAFLMWQNQGRPGAAAGLTSHDLANALGVTPRTIRDNINKHGRRVGIESVAAKHRNNINKRLYFFNTLKEDSDQVRKEGRRLWYDWLNERRRKLVEDEFGPIPNRTITPPEVLDNE